jgi:ribonuclease E
MPAAKTEQVKSEVVDFEVVAEVVSNAPEVASSPAAAGEREHPKRNNARRGPNRRRPRNPNYKRPETDGDSNGSPEASGVSNDESRPAPRSYDNDFAGRAERAERPEPQANASSQAGSVKQQSEAPKPVATSESAPAPKPVEVIKQEAE